MKNKSAKYKVNVGYDVLGREKNKRFTSLEAACAFRNAYFNKKGVVLCVSEIGKRK